MKVVRKTMIHLEIPEPVYDIEVERNHNFKLVNGPIVHNSKDCSDALAGVVSGLTLRRDTWIRWGVPINAILYKKVISYDKRHTQPEVTE